MGSDCSLFEKARSFRGVAAGGLFHIDKSVGKGADVLVDTVCEGESCGFNFEGLEYGGEAGGGGVVEEGDMGGTMSGLVGGWVEDVVEEKVEEVFGGWFLGGGVVDALVDYLAAGVEFETEDVPWAACDVCLVC